MGWFGDILIDIWIPSRPFALSGSDQLWGVVGFAYALTICDAHGHHIFCSAQLHPGKRLFPWFLPGLAGYSNQDNAHARLHIAHFISGIFRSKRVANNLDSHCISNKNVQVNGSKYCTLATANSWRYNNLSRLTETVAESDIVRLRLRNGSLWVGGSPSSSSLSPTTIGGC